VVAPPTGVARARRSGIVPGVADSDRPAAIVLAEDSFIVREGVRMLLEQAGYEVVADVEDLDSLLAAVAETSPDVVVTDIRMPPTRTDEGIRGALQIRSQHPGIGVVVLSQYVEPDYALRLLADGSAGLAYLLKERVGDLDELANAIEEVRRGGSVVDPKVVDALVAGHGAARRSKLDRLTPRETEVLAEIASGKSNAAIAASLFLSLRAVEKHINSIFTKLDLLPEPESNRRVRSVLLYLSAGGP
jgi:DNA-binding NarL/FixJ family response regulator